MATTKNLGMEITPTSNFVSPEPFNRNFEKLDALGKKYIVDSGKSGEWRFTEYSDGSYECFMAKSFTDVAMNSQWGVFYTAYIAAIAFPISFKSKPHMTLTWDTTANNSALAVHDTGLTTSSTGGILLCSPASGKKTTGLLSIHVSGEK